MRERLLDRPGPADSLKQTGCAVKLQAALFAAPSGKLRVFFNSELKCYLDVMACSQLLTIRKLCQPIVRIAEQSICMLERPAPDWGATPLQFSRPIRFLIGNGRNKQKFRLATELGRGAPTRPCGSASTAPRRRSPRPVTRFASATNTV
jgi:hypothetical protein